MPVMMKTKKNIGTSGLAEVRPLKDGLRIIFEDGDQYQVSNEGWERPAGKYNITLDQSNNKILWASPPPKSVCLVKFAEFGHRVNEVPEPNLKRGGVRKGKNGGTYVAPDELQTVAMLEIVDESAYEGMRVPYTFPYAFERYQSTMNTQITASAGRLARIEEFFRVTGFDLTTEDIPFSDNVLPWLEERLQDADKVFSISFNDKGYIESLTEIPEFLLPDKKPAKKTTRRKTAKK